MVEQWWRVHELRKTNPPKRWSCIIMHTWGPRVERLSGEGVGNLVLIKLVPRRSTEQVLFIICAPVASFENDTPKGGRALLYRNGRPRVLWLSIGYGFQVF